MTAHTGAPGTSAPDTSAPGTRAEARRVAATVPDPELPMLTVADLGILRDVTTEDGHLVVSLTPTYSGCPALREIQRDVAARLGAAGFADVEVRLQLSPPWTADWITAEGRRKLAAAGIAPPHPAPRRAEGPIPLTLSPPPSRIACPACGSTRTERTAAFSGTACKDLYRCLACAEPFEHIKEI